ncbi:hypothetical protein GcM3_024055 [Golovinomyces cichoracearum]|uniref:Uncharacterized protein n=1 Tax=Golovinomyces cichoracearum TaxID=62708 RepID=A0A420J6U1_9PEZI|nr:hypothetical protein GcM3_024055 [Golovinomyces cichoracearum]
MMSLWLGPDARKYIKSVAFISFKNTADQRNTGGLKSYAIHRKVYHYQADLGLETALTVPQFCQLSLFDPKYAR